MTSACGSGRSPSGFCNRYVGTGLSDFALLSPVAGAAADDVATAVGRVEEATFARLHITSLAVGLTERRGLAEAFLRSVRLPRRVRAGARVRATLRLQRYQGRTLTRHVALRVPAGVRPGRRTITFTGGTTGADETLDEIIEEALDDGSSGDAGPRSVHGVVRSLRTIHRGDGVEARFPGARPRHPVVRRVYRDPSLLVSGRANTRVRVVTRRSSKSGG